MNTRPLPIRFWEKVNKNGPIPAHRPELGPCWIWTGARHGPKGYGDVTVSGQQKDSAHRVAWILQFGAIPQGLCVCHHCDEKVCMRGSHLFLGTTGDNTRDCKSKNRNARGETQGLAKATWKIVAEIRRLRQERMTCRALGKMFGLDPSTICDIANYKTWRDSHAPPDA